MNSRRIFLSEKLRTAGLVVPKKAIKVEGGGEENKVLAKEESSTRADLHQGADLLSGAELLPRSSLVLSAGCVVQCCVQAMLQWDNLVVHLNIPTTRSHLHRITQCLDNFASTFPTVNSPR